MKNFFFIRAILLPIPRTFLICTLLFSIVNISSAQTHTPITKSIDPLIQGYWEYLPEGYNGNSNNYPLLVFFHGVGEVGNGSQTALPKVLKNGIPKLINNGIFPKKFKVNGKEYSFIVISPQIKTTDRNPQMVKALLEYCKKQYRVDESRIYITGLSQGGGTVWQLSSKGMYVIGKGFEYIANSLAAIAPICGNYPSSTESSAVLAKAGLPVWIMHNDGDNIVAPQTSKDWYNNLLANGIDPSTLLTLNHASGHDAWTKGYDPNWRPNGMNMYEWMLQYSRKSATEVTKDGPVTQPENQAPAAVINTAKTVTMPVDSLLLDGSTSKDSDGSIKAYAWKLVSGPAGYTLSDSKQSKLYVTKVTAGTYNFQLTVTDDKQATGNANVNIVVNPAPNVVPVASAKAPASITLPVDSLTLDGSASYDKDGSIKQYKWELTTAPAGYIFTAANAATVKLSSLVVGSYTATLTITDNDGATASAKTSFVVNKAPNVAPVASVKAPASITLPVDSLTLDGSASYDKDGSIKQYKWELTTAPAGYSFTAANAATVKLSSLVVGSYTA
ncbi:PKD domain-containing protein, partial [Foetidibacter luteolus]|uniref:carboxylesterase family protein n=1 Tax=Foetidibacter luteolus TaxID=2608880 RepID=UPI00129B7FEE